MRPTVARIGLAVGLFLLTLFLCDKAIGAFRPPVSKPANELGLTRAANAFGTHLEPGFGGTYSNAEYSIPITINSRGLRGPERPTAKPAGTYRILAIGDSFTFGQGVADADTWVRRLERAGVEAINAGWSDDGPLGYRDYLLHHGLDYDPDVILVGVFVGNDVVDTLAADEAGDDPVGRLAVDARYMGNLQLQVGITGRVRELVSLAFPNLYELTSLALIRAQYFLGSYRAHFDYILEEPERPAIARGWELSFAALREMAAFAQAHGRRFGIIVFPFLDQVRDVGLPPGHSAEHPSRRIAAFCAGERVPCLDLLVPFRQAGDPFALYYLKDGHLTALGNQVAGRAIAAWLSQERLGP